MKYKMKKQILFYITTLLVITVLIDTVQTRLLGATTPIRLMSNIGIVLSSAATYCFWCKVK